MRKHGEHGGCTWIGGIKAREEQDMSQCLRCNKPCEATFVFCDNCQSLLRSQLGQVVDTFEQEEQGNRRQLRASRLSPIRDISADIQRQSTIPLPQITKKLQHDQEEDLGKRMPHLWPWLQQDSDPGESESDSWSNGIDPLMA